MPASRSQRDCRLIQNRSDVPKNRAAIQGKVHRYTESVRKPATITSFSAFRYAPR